MELIDHFVKLVYPFNFNGDTIDTLIQDINNFTYQPVFKPGEEKPVWNADRTIDESFLPHIQSILSNEEPCRYLYQFSLADELIQTFFYHGNQFKEIVLANQSLRYQVRINTIELWMIRSGVGFIVLDLSINNTKSIDSLIDFIYTLKHSGKQSFNCYLDRQNPHPSFVAAVTQKAPLIKDWVSKFYGSDEIGKLFEFTNALEGQDIQSGSIRLSNILGFIEHLVFYNHRELSPKAIHNLSFTFSYVKTGLVDRYTLRNRQFLFRHAMKHSYLPSEEDLIGSSGEYLQTFDNIHFGSALEGFCVWLEDNGHPFFSQFDYRVQNRFFLIYMLNLILRVSLLGFRQQLDNNIPDNFGNLKSSKHLSGDIRHLRNSIMSFYLNVHFVQVSNITHIERVNMLIKENFNIDMLMTEIKNKTEELDKYLSSENERRTNNLLSLLTIISAVLAPITIITGIFGMNFTFKGIGEKQQLLFEPVWFYWCLAGWAVICFPLVVVFLRKRIK